MEPIVFYDLKRETAKELWAFSPNTWRSRAALNIKGIPYKTVWLDFVELKPTLSKLDLEPVLGPVPYTVPTIYDPNTKKAIMDSQAINRYLEEQYPDRHVLFPKGTAALQAAWVDNITPKMIGQTLDPLLVMHVYNQASPADRKYLRDTRRKMFGAELEQIEARGEVAERLMKNWEKQLADAGKWIDLNGHGSVFIGGCAPVNADLDLHAVLKYCTLLAPDSRAASLALTTQNGRWANYLKAFEKWAQSV
ncbi:hypothetical protein K488DRAFT_82343 [Vararia minispora EC-137]|uniref:Uncharacterized protein n=1 Tax=Vararia minispora EC-137 TaxID=1314806 RepID=A0ACB8QWG6_9AGAM|nr:hypothetical protein K488DRAFT_82343 [Vararia minispora EC-137]